MRAQRANGAQVQHHSTQQPQLQQQPQHAGCVCPHTNRAISTTACGARGANALRQLRLREGEGGVGGAAGQSQRVCADRGPPRKHTHRDTAIAKAKRKLLPHWQPQGRARGPARNISSAGRRRLGAGQGRVPASAGRSCTQQGVQRSTSGAGGLAHPPAVASGRRPRQSVGAARTAGGAAGGGSAGRLVGRRGASEGMAEQLQPPACAPRGARIRSRRPQADCTTRAVCLAVCSAAGCAWAAPRHRACTNTRWPAACTFTYPAATARVRAPP